MDLVLKEVVTHRDWRSFIEFPKKLFKDNSCFIPSLDSDYKYFDAKFWLAMRGKEIVGRVGTIINNRANRKWDEKLVRFGWFDFVEDMPIPIRRSSETKRLWCGNRNTNVKSISEEPCFQGIKLI